jgi:uroporphyrinogen-III synthase
MYLTRAMLNHVFLLKNPDEISHDPYQHALMLNGFTSRIIPTLTQSYIDPDGLVNIITHEEEVYGGVIVTSGRAADAWDNAIKTIEDRGKLSFCPEL